MTFYKSKRRFEPKRDGFHGVYWECKAPSDAALICMLGDDAEDYLAKSGAKWASRLGLNVLTMSPDKHDYGHHNYPVDRIEAATAWLMEHGSARVGITGASTTGMLALVAASLVPQLTLTMAFTPSDFVWQGFQQGKRDGAKEWPVEGESTLSWRGEPLPYMRFCYQHPDYWRVIEQQTKEAKSMIASRKVFDDSERECGIPDEAFIRVEDIRGRLLLVGAEDDVLWDCARYIRRMEARLERLPHECRCEALVYAHGTHFVFPESFMRTMFPVGSGLALRLAFSAARGHEQECRATRENIDRHVRDTIASWLRGE